MLKRGQIVKIKPNFYKVCNNENIEDYITCKVNHSGKNLMGEVMECVYCGDGMYSVLLLLNTCGELHPIVVEPKDVKIDTIKTLKNLKKRKCALLK